MKRKCVSCQSRWRQTSDGLEKMQTGRRTGEFIKRGAHDVGDGDGDGDGSESPRSRRRREMYGIDERSVGGKEKGKTVGREEVGTSEEEKMEGMDVDGERLKPTLSSVEKPVCPSLF